jgi:SAM-dependent methyltransferase
VKDAAYYNRVYRGKYDIDLRILRIVAGLCRGKVLDIGCGDATLATLWEGTYMGIDFSEAAIELARDKVVTPLGMHVVDVLGDQPLPLSNCESPYGGAGGTRWDTIVLGQFLEHIEEGATRTLFPKVRDALAPGGQVIVTVPRGNAIPDPAHCRTFSECELAMLLSRELGPCILHPCNPRNIVATVEVP